MIGKRMVWSSGVLNIERIYLGLEERLGTVNNAYR